MEDASQGNNVVMLHHNGLRGHADDKDIATKAVTLVVASARKGIVALCCAVAHILKEKDSLEKQLITALVPGHEVEPFPAVIQREICDKSSPKHNFEHVVIRRTSEQVTSFPWNSPQLSRKCYEQLQHDCCVQITTATLHCPSSEDDVVKASVVDALESKNTMGVHSDDALELKSSRFVSTQSIGTQCRDHSLEPSDDGDDYCCGTAEHWMTKYRECLVRIGSLEKQLQAARSEQVSKENSKHCLLNYADVQPGDGEVDGVRCDVLRRSPVMSPSPLVGCVCRSCIGQLRASYLGNNSFVEMFVLAKGERSLLQAGARVIIAGSRGGTVKYVGHLDGVSKPCVVYAGIQLDTAQGNTDGKFLTKRYFTCWHNFGIFTPLHEILFIIKHAESRTFVKLD